jgi:hypothetical protein
MTTQDHSEASRPSETAGAKDPHSTYDEGQIALETMERFLAKKKSGKTAESPEAPSAPQGS